jgi:hypothetical protein
MANRFKKNNYDSVINRTIYNYFLDRAREFRYLLYEYKTCTELDKRRELRKRKQYLVSILDKAIAFNKCSLNISLGIPYAELKNYPHLLEIKAKQQHLIRSIA